MPVSYLSILSCSILFKLVYFLDMFVIPVRCLFTQIFSIYFVSMSVALSSTRQLLYCGCVLTINYHADCSH